MQMTSYNRKLQDGTLEADALGSPIVYTMGGPADERVHADAVNVVTSDVGPDLSMDAGLYYAQAGAAHDAWKAMLAK